MDKSHHRQESVPDATDLLLKGFWKPRPKSSGGWSPPPTTASAYFDGPVREPAREPAQYRGRHRKPEKRNHVSPSVEDEVDSLAREFKATSITSDDEPPSRGAVDQHPLIIDVDVPASEMNLDSESDNPERRFVFVPKSDTESSTTNKEELKKEARSRRSKSFRHQSKKWDSGKEPNTSRTDHVRGREPTLRDDTLHPHIDIRPSKHDLPSIETQQESTHHKRSASAYPCIESEKDEEFRYMGSSKKHPGDGLLSPDVGRSHSRGYFDQSSNPARQRSPHQSQNPSPASDKRSNRSSWSQSPRPNSDYESGSRSRSGTIERPPKPPQETEDNLRRGERRSQRPASVYDPNSLSRTSSRQDQGYYPGEDDFADSDYVKERRDGDRRHRYSRDSDTQHRFQRSPTASNRSSTFDVSLQPKPVSPLPSPKISPNGTPRTPKTESFGRSDTFPSSRDPKKLNSRPVSPTDDKRSPSEKLNPSDRDRPPNHRANSRQGNVSPIPGKKYPSPTSSHASIAMPMPTGVDLVALGDTQYPPVEYLDEDELANYKASSSSNSKDKDYWQPPPFQPPASSTHLERPVGSYRRYSEDIERGNAPPLVPCPRTTYTRGRNDWLTLPQCPNFDICSSCYESSIAPTEFRYHFIPAPFRPAETEVLCDFGSSPWYRIAWLLTLKDHRRDLELFYRVAEIAANTQPCLGKHEAIRQWHSIIDPMTGRPIRNFDVCFSCAKTVEALLPALRGIFVRNDANVPPGSPRICDLRFDSKRFIQYFDALETTADSVDSSYSKPDTRHLASVIRRLSMIEECQKDEDLTDCYWHIITQLPEFTVCPECWDEVVRPELEKGKAIPAMFNKVQQRLPRSSCQLYSERMRNIFRRAVDTNDYMLLANKARERKAIEAKYKLDLADLRRLSNAGGPSASEAEWEMERIADEWKQWNNES
ncbi:hypothetical protein F5884DRAFT_745773 [Xylogone sp. PMI_703]|nr:hypothetical protein F5884DRAFT_745773 [Xylogone sp. PMI_703]